MGRPKKLTADEWDTCTYPGTMLPHLRTDDPRKLRLFVCACCRRVWEMLFDERSKRVVETAELWADGQTTDRVLKAIQFAGCLADKPTPSDISVLNRVKIPKQYEHDRRFYYAARAARSAGVLRKDWVVNSAWTARKAADNVRDEEIAQCHLIRCIFDNPFRPVTFSPSWRTESAVALARTAYDTRNFSLLPILADSLEEADCDHADILAHCRDPKAIHARGCWVVDLVLDKS